MDINRIGSTYPNQVVQRSSEQSVRGAGDEKPLPGKDVAVEPDSVRLSRGYQDMSRVKNVMMDRAEIRNDRVTQYRDMVANHAYVVEPEKIAEKMLEEVW